MPTRVHIMTTRVIALAALLVLAGQWLAAATPAARFNGRPKFDSGRAMGYFVWREGETWKVRWTTFGAEHRFSGRVVADGGALSDLKRIDVDEERKVIAPGRPARVVRGPRGRVRGAVVRTRDEDHIEQENERLLRFTALTDDDIDGFDIKARGVTALRFFLEIDGVPRPAEIEIGRDNVVVAETPLVATLPE